MSQTKEITPDIRPSPRLELRWRYSTEEEQVQAAIGEAAYACDYGIVIPVPRNDIRSNVYDKESDREIYGARSEVFYKFSTTLRGGGKPPSSTETPFRDGVHAMEDAKKLGGLEVWIESLFGDQSRWPCEEERTK